MPEPNHRPDFVTLEEIKAHRRYKPHMSYHVKQTIIEDIRRTRSVASIGRVSSINVPSLPVTATATPPTSESKNHGLRSK